MREAAGRKSEMTQIRIRQETMVQWVVLRPIFQVCSREKGYKGRGEQEGFLVEPRGNIETNSVHLVKNLARG